MKCIVLGTIVLVLLCSSTYSQNNAATATKTIAEGSSGYLLVIPHNPDEPSAFVLAYYNKQEKKMSQLGAWPVYYGYRGEDSSCTRVALQPGRLTFTVNTIQVKSDNVAKQWANWYVINWGDRPTTQNRQFNQCALFNDWSISNSQEAILLLYKKSTSVKNGLLLYYRWNGLKDALVAVDKQYILNTIQQQKILFDFPRSDWGQWLANKDSSIILCKRINTALQLKSIPPRHLWEKYKDWKWFLLGTTEKVVGMWGRSIKGTKENKITLLRCESGKKWISIKNDYPYTSSITWMDNWVVMCIKQFNPRSLHAPRTKTGRYKIINRTTGEISDIELKEDSDILWVDENKTILVREQDRLVEMSPQKTGEWIKKTLSKRKAVRYIQQAIPVKTKPVIETKMLKKTFSVPTTTK